jgi:hypothetical protein
MLIMCLAGGLPVDNCTEGEPRDALLLAFLCFWGVLIILSGSGTSRAVCNGICRHFADTFFGGHSE